MPNIFQNGSNSIRKTAPPEKSEPEPFLEKRSPAKQSLIGAVAAARLTKERDGKRKTEREKKKKAKNT